MRTSVNWRGSSCTNRKAGLMAPRCAAGCRNRLCWSLRAGGRGDGSIFSDETRHVQSGLGRGNGRLSAKHGHLLCTGCAATEIPSFHCVRCNTAVLPLTF